MVLTAAATSGSETTLSRTSPRSAAGSARPTFEVLTVAVNSGLAAYPVGFRRVWQGAGGALWRPLPPPGGVGGGLFATGAIRHSAAPR